MSNEEDNPASFTPVKPARRLAAILHADVHGYSRRIHDDEAGTLQILTPSLALLRTLVEQHGGRAVGSRGDSLLAEFPSVVEAVQCAVEMQRELKTRSIDLPEHKRLAFRIGISLGEIVIDGDQPHGDGINIAVRIEGLAAPGGICMADVVYQQVKNKLPLQYEDLGLQQLKNIPEPVRVWRIVLDGSESPKSEVQSARAKGENQKPRRVSPNVFVFVLVFVVLLGGLATFWAFFPAAFRIPHSELRTQEAQPPSLPLPDKPSIVVLPFTNMSNDPAQEYFSDGLTEDLTSALSRLSGLFVIARNSAFTYKGKAVKIQDVSREMGVRYVLEGSVRKAGDQVRITAQLIDGTTGGHVWSERYDRPLTDIFTVQDEITQHIVAALRVEMQEAELARVRRVPTENLTAYDLYLRGVESSRHAYFGTKKEANEHAQQLLEQAIKLDPQYAEAYALLGLTYTLGWLNGWNRTPEVLERWNEVVRQALALDASLPAAHQSLAWVSLFQRQHDQAIAAAKQAIALDPNSAEGYLTLGTMLNFAGSPGESIEWVQQAMRLNPRYGPGYPLALGWAYVIARRYEEALVPLKQALPLMPNNLQLHWAFVICYVELGWEEEAWAAAAEMLRISPQFSTEAMRPFMPEKDPARTESHLAALRKAGLQ